MHLEGAPAGHANWHVRVTLLGEEPIQVAPALRQCLTGRSSPEASRRLFASCFELITPLPYDFAR